MRTLIGIIVVLSITVISSGCGSMAALNESGRVVQVVQNPDENCKYLGSFYGRSHAPEYAINNLRNIVGSKGGTHVVLTNASQLTQGQIIELPVGGNSLTINGLGYICK